VDICTVNIVIDLTAYTLLSVCCDDAYVAMEPASAAGVALQRITLNNTLQTIIYKAIDS